MCLGLAEKWGIGAVIRIKSAQHVNVSKVSKEYIFPDHSLAQHGIMEGNVSQ